MTTSLATGTAPARSLRQRRQALQQANRIRTYRKERKQDLKAGRADPVALLLDPPGEMATMKVFDLLIAMPRIGRVKANRALVRCRVSPSKTLGGMTGRQRDELARALGRR
jgi:hypothetical protein